MFRRKTTRAILTALTLSGVALIGGCGGLSRPLAPDQAAISESPPSKAMPRAAKSAASAAAHARNAARRFSHKGGEMSVSLPGYGDEATVRVENAKFTMKQGTFARNKKRALSEEYEIAMTAHSGAAVNDVAVAFGPDGTVFSQPASLTLHLRGPVDPGRLRAYHISDGTVTQTPFTISRRGHDRWEVTLQVPGFSVYTLGDELDGILAPETMEGMGLEGY
jgi:hypothetical protein